MGNSKSKPKPIIKNISQATFLNKLPKQRNILILGETGVGKSTWINSFINFVHYSSLKTAEGADLHNLIPSEFTVINEDFEEIRVSTSAPDGGGDENHDTNEVLNAGKSATQNARMYTLPVGKSIIKLIDTPGVGDTRGVEQDRKNLDTILAILRELDEIHGICILLKPNHARLSLMFRFCIKELLTYLHKDATKNIMFCFTNTRGTFYRPGDTLPALQTLLEEIPEIDIEVSPKSVYCFDSEAYRFLVALKNSTSLTFSEEEHENFAQSWTKSITETRRMLAHIIVLPPHPVYLTLGLNRSRDLVVKLVKPLADIDKVIRTKKAIVDDENSELERLNQKLVDLRGKEVFKTVELEVRPLPHPRTVCTNGSCVRVRGGVTEYLSVCHSPCGCGGVPQDTVGDHRLMNCWAMSNGICRHGNCKHDYREHVNICYETVPVVKEAADKAVVQSLQDTQAQVEVAMGKVAELEKELEGYEEEMKVIKQASATFARAVKTYAIMAYNDGMEEYLDHLIRLEEDNAIATGESEAVNSLKVWKEVSLFEKKILEEAMAAGGDQVDGAEEENVLVSGGEVEKMVNALKEQTRSAELLEEVIECIQKLATRDVDGGWETLEGEEEDESK